MDWTLVKGRSRFLWSFWVEEKLSENLVPNWA